MNYKELKTEISRLDEKNLRLRKQTHIMHVPQYSKTMNEDLSVSKQRELYNICKAWDEFSYLENKTLFFIDKYLKRFTEGLKVNEEIIDGQNIILPSNSILEEAVYYFDSFINSFSEIIDEEEKKVLDRYLDEKELNKVFPSKNIVGIYWKINFLKNKVINFRSTRYDLTRKEQLKYYDFSSKIKTINIDKNGDIHVKCSLIDIEKCKAAKQAIKLAIYDKTINPYELVFPNRVEETSKISNNIDVYFDYVNSGIKIIREIHRVLEKINKLFLDKFVEDVVNIDEIFSSKTSVNLEEKEMKYSVFDVFKRQAEMRLNYNV